MSSRPPHGKTFGGLLDQVSRDGHELIQLGQDPETGLQAVIAIHSTRLGPAIGGVRMYPYHDTDDALVDALKLSRGMTYKAAAAGVRLGGGKAVIIGEPRRQKTVELLESFAGMVEALGGRYLAAEDVGTDERDIATMRAVTCHTSDPADNGAYFTALGALHAARACLWHLHGDDRLDGRHFAVQGLGRTGWELAALLAARGATLTVTDIEPSRAARARRELGARVVGPETILFVECDVLAPCALGGVISARTAHDLRCSAVAGTANNVLADRLAAAALRESGIVMAPDYVANAGGIIKVAADLDGLDDMESERRTARIYENTLRVLDVAEARGSTPQQEADRLARRVLQHPPGGESHFFEVPAGIEAAADSPTCSADTSPHAWQRGRPKDGTPLDG